MNKENKAEYITGTIAIGRLSAMLRTTIHCIGEDDNRAYLTGVNIDNRFSDGKYTTKAISCNGTTLAHYKYSLLSDYTTYDANNEPVENVDFNFIIGKKDAKKISALHPNKDLEVKTRFKYNLLTNILTIAGDDFDFSTLSKKRYPDTDELFSFTSTRFLKVETKLIANVVAFLYKECTGQYRDGLIIESGKDYVTFTSTRETKPVSITVPAKSLKDQEGNDVKGTAMFATTADNLKRCIAAMIGFECTLQFNCVLSDKDNNRDKIRIVDDRPKFLNVMMMPFRLDATQLNKGE